MAKRNADSGCSSSSKRPRIDLGADAFDCPICSNIMLNRIFQCSGGHSICEDCLDEIRKTPAPKCPSCSVKYTKKAVRNFSLEGLVAQCTLPCRFECGFTAKPPELINHENCCVLKPVPCLVHSCSHQCSAKNMEDHILKEHALTQHADANKEDWEWEFVLMESGRAISISPGDGTYTKGVLFGKVGALLCINNRRVNGGTYKADAIHFGTPMRYCLEFEDGPSSVKVTGLTRGLNETHEIPGRGAIELPMAIYQQFLKQDANGKPQARMKITASAWQH